MATAFELSDIALPVATSTTVAVKRTVSYCFTLSGNAVTVNLAFLSERDICAFVTVLLALNPVVPPYEAVIFELLYFLNATMLVVATPFLTLILLDTVIPFILNTRFPPFTKFPLMSFTLAVNVMLSPITPFTLLTVTTVAFGIIGTVISLIVPKL